MPGLLLTTPTPKFENPQYIYIYIYIYICKKGFQMRAARDPAHFLEMRGDFGAAPQRIPSGLCISTQNPAWLHAW